VRSRGRGSKTERGRQERRRRSKGRNILGEGIERNLARHRPREIPIGVKNEGRREKGRIEVGGERRREGREGGE
jgi:hypothetical protein